MVTCWRCGKEIEERQPKRASVQIGSVAGLFPIYQKVILCPACYQERRREQWRAVLIGLGILAVFLTFYACSALLPLSGPYVATGTPTLVYAPVLTHTPMLAPALTSTPIPTDTPAPIPAPTSTPILTDTPASTDTPLPTPTDTPIE